MKLFLKEYKFIAGANHPSQVPYINLPEFAFIGRSNVGKSSLINSLTNRKCLAKVSSTPGRTKQINFFSLDSLLVLVDLPGYGYAKLSKKEISNLRGLIYYYLTERINLKRVFLLIDSRHGLKKSDQEIMELMDEYATPYQIVLTKSDKTSKTDIQKIVESFSELSQKHPAMVMSEIICTSSSEKQGIDLLQLEISKFI